MTRAQLLRLLEETLGLKQHTLTGAEKLRDLQVWDSMSTLLFIALADKKFGLALPASRVMRSQTVEELIGLLGNASQAA